VGLPVLLMGGKTAKERNPTKRTIVYEGALEDSGKLSSKKLARLGGKTNR